MVQKIFSCFLVLVFSIFCCGTAAAGIPDIKAEKLQVLNSLKDHPLKFEKNLGQTSDEVTFFSRGNGYSLFLTPTESVMVLSRLAEGKVEPGLSGRRSFVSGSEKKIETSVIRMKIAGANPRPGINGRKKLNSTSHYFKGNDQKKWRRSVPHFEAVHYEEVYSGVDLVYYGNQGKLEYDFIVKPGADPETILLEFSGADRLSLDGDGNLIIESGSEKVVQQAPLAYQKIDGKNKTVASRYVLKPNHQAAFHVGAYNQDQELIIDPVLKFSTYLGGGSSDEAYAIAVDDDENVYVTGSTRSIDFDTLNEIEGNDTDMDVFVFKLENVPQGMDLVYSTYIGGDSFEQGQDIAVDASGNAFVTGWTESSDFNTVNPIEGDSGGRDVFVLKLSDNAGVPNLDFSTYLGGSGLDQSEGLALDSSGNIYVAGWTQSNDFDTLNPIEGASGFNDAFVFKLADGPTGPSLLYSTYIGGSLNDEAYAIAVDSSDNALVAGRTFSSDFNTVNAIDTPDLASDIFVFKLQESAGTLSLVYSTYISGSAGEEVTGIAVNAEGHAYVTGYTASTDFPVINAIEGDSGDSTWDAYVFKLQEFGATLFVPFSTYLGGDGADFAQDIALDSSGNIFVAGYTLSTDFDLLNEIEGDGVGTDIFITKMEETPAGPVLSYSTYLGGNGNDRAFALDVDSKGDAYIAGWSSSLDYDVFFPIESASGISDVIVTKLGDEDVTPPVVTPPPDITREATGPVTPIDIGEATVTDDFSDPDDIIMFSNDPGQYVLGTAVITWTAVDEAGNSSSATQNITVVDTTSPVLTLNGANPLTHELGSPYVDPWAVAVDVHDGPVGVSLVSNELSPSSFEMIYTATDLSGNSTSQTRLVNFVDTTPPDLTLLGPNPAVFDNVPFVEPGFTAIDAVVGTVPVTVTASGPQTGTFTLTYTATDFAGNSSSLVRAVTIIDSVPPVITPNGPNPLNHEIGTPYVDPWAVAQDNVNGEIPISLSSSQISPNQFEITYTATDLAGNTGTATRIVNFVDTTPPNLTLQGPNPAVFNNVPFVEPGFTAIDSAGGVVPVTVTASGPQTGTFTLTYTATDFAGNTASATRTVTINDTFPPSIIMNGPNPLIHEMGTPYVDPWADAIDNVNGEVPVTLVSNQISPSEFEITYTATDLAGNSSSATRLVNLVDTTPPTLTLQGPNPVVFNNVPFVEPGFTAVDSTGGTVPVMVNASGPQTGTFTLTYTAIDFAGNTATATRVVTVNDTVSPVVTLNGDNPIILQSGQPFIDPWATSVDNVDGPILVVASSFQVNPTTFEVTYFATDLAGNTGSATRTINILP